MYLTSITYISHIEKMWEVIQTTEFKEWYDDLDEDAMEDILSSIIIFKIRTNLEDPKVDTLKRFKD